MTSQLIDADERLSAVFSHFYCVQLNQDDPALRQQLMPNYEMLLVFNFGPGASILLGDATYHIGQTAVIGPLQKTLTYTLPSGAAIIVVNFTLNGFYRLLGVSMQQLKMGDVYNPDVLLNNSSFRDLWNQLASMPTLQERLQVISNYVLTFAASSDVAAQSLLETIPYFNESTTDPVKAVAQTNQVSPRSVQQHFQTYLGYSAKELVRFLRFKKVLTYLYQGPDQSVDWLGLVLTFGYYDHSHLIKDFKYFLGITPRQFLKQLAQGGVCISKSGKFY